MTSEQQIMKLQKRIKELENEIEAANKCGYTEGLKEAWKCASLFNKLPIGQIQMMTGTQCEREDLFDEVSVFQAVVAAQQFTKSFSDIEIGDEIITDSQQRGAVILVTSCTVAYLTSDGHYYSSYPEKVKKTGRHFDQINQILETMREEE